MPRDVAMVQLLNATPTKIYEYEAEPGLGDGVVLFVGWFDDTPTDQIIICFPII